MQVLICIQVLFNATTTTTIKYYTILDLILLNVRGLVQVPNTRLAVQVRYLQSDQLYYLVLGIAVYMTGIL